MTPAHSLRLGVFLVDFLYFLIMVLTKVRFSLPCILHF